MRKCFIDEISVLSQVRREGTFEQQERKRIVKAEGP